jgi:hypothetical protein
MSTFTSKMGGSILSGKIPKSTKTFECSQVDKTQKLCEALIIHNSWFTHMNKGHKRDKSPLDGDVMTYDFHKYHALGNDYIVIDPNKTNTKLSVQRAELPGDVDMITGSPFLPAPAAGRRGIQPTCP